MKKKLLTKSKEVEPKELPVEEVNVNEPEDEDDEDMDHDNGTASTASMEVATALVSAVFNVGSDFTVTSFKVGGNKCTIGLNNKDYEITVTFKDAESLGIINR